MAAGKNKLFAFGLIVGLLDCFLCVLFLSQSQNLSWGKMKMEATIDTALMDVRFVLSLSLSLSVCLLLSLLRTTKALR